MDNIKTYFCIKFKDNGKRYNSYKSLDEFCTKSSECIMNKYVICTKDYKRENGVDYIPVYMTMFLRYSVLLLYATSHNSRFIEILFKNEQIYVIAYKGWVLFVSLSPFMHEIELFLLDFSF